MGVVGVFNTVKSLRKHFSHHPLTRDNVNGALVRFARYQFAWRMAGAPTVINWVGDTRLIVGAGMRGVTAEAYTGLNEFADVLFCGHFLRPNDLFVDVGANVGSYSVVAAAVAGANAIAIEPISTTIPQLEDHLRLNRIELLVEIAQVGISNEPGELWFTGDADALNRVTQTPDDKAVRIPVITLDTLVADRNPVCLKIDVELHEPQVLAGARATLAKPSLQAVLIETAPENRTDAIRETFASHGFVAHRYDPRSRDLTRTDSFSSHNTLFVRDADFVRDRLNGAAAIRVGKDSY